MTMSVGVLDHYNVSTRKLKETVQFYEDVLGFVNGPRPPFNFPGAWLYSASHPVLHINDISATDKPQRPDSGVIDQFEFRHIDRDNRPDWFLAISPHKKVPVLSVDNKVSLFESNAINEYLDETIEPRLHPADPVQRAINRAWTDFLPTFSEMVTGQAYADDEAEYKADIAKMPQAFEKLEGALKAPSLSRPFINGAKYSRFDAAYTPFLQRYYY